MTTQDIKDFTFSIKSSYSLCLEHLKRSRKIKSVEGKQSCKITDVKFQVRFD